MEIKSWLRPTLPASTTPKPVAPNTASGSSQYVDAFQAPATSPDDLVSQAEQLLQSDDSTVAELVNVFQQMTTAFDDGKQRPPLVTQELLKVVDELSRRALANPPPPSDQATHVVKKGESIWLIAEGLKKAGVSPLTVPQLVAEIEKMNPQVKNPNLIYPGQNLTVPAKPDPESVLRCIRDSAKELTQKIQAGAPGSALTVPPILGRSTQFGAAELEKAEALLKDSDATPKELADAYDNLLKDFPKGTKRPRAASDNLSAVVGALESRALAVAAGDSKEQQSISAAAAQLRSQIRACADASALSLPDLLVSPPVPPDPQQLAKAKRVEAAYEKTTSAWASNPLDNTQVVVNPTQGPDAVARAWKQGLSSLAGEGEQGAMKRFLSQSDNTLQDLAQVVTRTREPKYPDFQKKDGVNRFYDHFQEPLLRALADANPGSQFRLMGCVDGTLPPRLMNGARYDSQIAIEMTQPNTVDGHAPASGDGSRYDYFFNPAILVSQIGRPSSIVHGLQSANLVNAWYQGVKAAGLPANADKGNAKDTLQYLEDFGLGERPWMMAGVAQMPMDQQVQFFKTVVAQSPIQNDPHRPLGGMLFRTDSGGPIQPLDPNHVIASVDASGLAAGLTPSTVDSAVSVTPAEGLNKDYNFVKNHFSDVTAAEIAKYTELRGDAPRALNAVQVANDVGISMSLPPDNLPATKQDWDAAELGQWPLYKKDGVAEKSIRTSVQKILEQAGVPPAATASVTALPVFFNSPQSGLVQLPLFRVVGSDGKEKYVDNNADSKVYNSIDDFRNDNQLPEGDLYCPQNGHLGSDFVRSDNKGSFWDKVTGWTDKVAFVGGVIVGVGAVVVTGGAAIPIAGAALAAYGAARSGSLLLDRFTHDQTLNPFDSSAARNDWVGLAANGLGFAAMGSGALANAMKDVPELTRLANTVGLASDVGNVGAIGSNVYDLASNWDQLSPDQRLSAIGQIVFWGGLSVKGVRDRVQEGFGTRPPQKILPDRTYSELKALQSQIAQATNPQERVAAQNQAVALLQDNLPQLDATERARFIDEFNASGIKLDGLENTLIEAGCKTSAAVANVAALNPNCAMGDDSLVTVDAAGHLQVAQYDESKAEDYLNAVKDIDFRLGNHPDSYKLRRYIMSHSGGRILSNDAFTYKYVDKDNNPLEASKRREWEANPENWLPERVEVQKKLLQSARDGATELSKAMTRSGQGNTLLAMRGNTAAGKSSLLGRDPQFNGFRKELEIGVINPDKFKFLLRGIDSSAGDPIPSSYQEHNEGSLLAQRLQDEFVQQQGSSVVIDKRFADPNGIPTLSGQARDAGKTMNLEDLDVPLDLSCARVLTRPPGGESPLVPFDAIAQGFEGVRGNRQQLIEGGDGYTGIKNDDTVKNYELWVNDSNGVPTLAAEKKDRVWKITNESLYATALTSPNVSDDRALGDTLITQDWIDHLVPKLGPDQTAALKEFIGQTIRGALAARSQLIPAALDVPTPSPDPGEG